MEKRKVRIKAGLYEGCMIILTDAPEDAIEKWCSDYNVEMENGKNSYFKSLSEKYYVRVLHDSAEDSAEDVEIIGYSETYDLCSRSGSEKQHLGISPECECKSSGRQDGVSEQERILSVIEGAIMSDGLKVLDGDRDCILVWNRRLDMDFEILVKQLYA